MLNYFKNEEAFTLLELIVVVAIIAILAAVIVPQISDVRGDAKEASVELDLKNMKTAVEKYYLDSDGGDGSYPAEGNFENDTGVTLGDYTYKNNSGDYLIIYDPGANTGTYESDDTINGDYYYIRDEDSKPQINGTAPTNP